jgi:glutamate/tyrosine decarboxylase-like PLP-dependent enzyme
MYGESWRHLLERALAHSVDFLEELPERPVAARARALEILARIDGPVPDRPSPPAEVIDDLVREAEPGLTAMPSGRFFGWVIGGGLPSAVAADWLTTVWDQNAGSAEGTPSAAAFEQVALRWVLELCDLPRHCSGALVTGAQMANTVCFWAARNRVLEACGWDVEADGLQGAPRLRVVVGAERHETIDRSVRQVGLGTRGMRVVDADAQGRMLAGAFRQALAELDGPLIVCAQAGNVNSGAIDPLPEIVLALEEWRAWHPEGAAWLHIDGAFGLWARASGALRASVEGAERADSWATDAHKWLNTPYDCGIALTAHPEAHRRALAIRAAYLPCHADPRVRTPNEWSPELSRRARGFALYAALRELGRAGVEAVVERCAAHARRFAERLGAEAGVEVMNEVCLNQVVVRFRDPSGRDDDAHTQEVVRQVQQSGTCFMSGTVWRGVAAMRISVSNWSTDDEDVTRSVEAILRAHRA